MFDNGRANIVQHLNNAAITILFFRASAFRKSIILWDSKLFFLSRKENAHFNMYVKNVKIGPDTKRFSKLSQEQIQKYSDDNCLRKYSFHFGEIFPCVSMAGSEKKISQPDTEHNLTGFNLHPKKKALAFY